MDEKEKILKKKAQQKSGGCVEGVVAGLFLAVVVIAGALGTIVYLRGTTALNLSAEPVATVIPLPTQVSAVVVPPTQVPICLVPSLVGLDEKAAELSLTSLGLQVIKSTGFSAAYAQGVVFEQDPAGQTRLEPCQGEVVMMISMGTEPQQAEPPTALPPTEAPPTTTPLPTVKPTITPIPSLTPTPPSLPQFYDSFDTGLSPEWQLSDPTHWASVNSQLKSLSGNAWMIVGQDHWQDYTVELEVIDIPNTYTACRLKILGGLSLTLSPSYNEVSWENGLNLSVENISTPYKLKLVTQGSLVTLFVNEVQQNQVNIPEYTSGKISLTCYYQGSIFDNFQVTPNSE